MSIKIAYFLLLTCLITSMGDEIDFVYNGFLGANLSINGAEITDNGLLKLTNATMMNQIGHAFFPLPLSFSNFSFSTTFVIAAVSKNSGSSGGNGMAFAISPSKSLPEAQPRQFLGLFSMANHGNPSNHIFAVEFDTIQNPEFEDIDDNHVGIDVNSLISTKSSPAGYFPSQDPRFKKLKINSGKPMQVWIEYVKVNNQLNVTLSPMGVPQPSRPLISTTINLSSIVTEFAYAGFSAASGTLLQTHYVLGWSFKTNNRAQPLNPSLLPSLPLSSSKPNSLKIGLPLLLAVFFAVTIIIAIIFIGRRKKKKNAQVLENWEHEIGAHRICYKDLLRATRGFSDTEIIGSGGFGKVYKGVLPGPESDIEVAVKRVTHNSEEGMAQFLAEIRSIGRIRNEKLVKLLGYCRLKGELLLIYEFVKNGSLDKFLYGQPRFTLNWSQRFQIAKDVASGLFFLHEKWERTVLHRDIKASNVLLDENFNGKLGDFGLARLCDHGTDPQASRVAGTIGYIAPELNTTGTATKYADVYAYGVFLLEVVCGRRPFDHSEPEQKFSLVMWVSECLESGRLLDAVDWKLSNLQQQEKEEVELVLKIGLLCLQSAAIDRPTMGEVMKFLNSNHPFPVVSPDELRASISMPSLLASRSQNLLSSPSLGSVSVLHSGR